MAELSAQAKVRRAGALHGAPSGPSRTLRGLGVRGVRRQHPPGSPTPPKHLAEAALYRRRHLQESEERATKLRRAFSQLLGTARELLSAGEARARAEDRVGAAERELASVTKELSHVQESVALRPRSRGVDHRRAGRRRCPAFGLEAIAGQTWVGGQSTCREAAGSQLSPACLPPVAR